MSRRSRRLHVRLLRAAGVAAAGAFVYQRWQLHPSRVAPASAYVPAAAHHTGAPATRTARWARLQGGTEADPFDVLVVGGGVSGLYTAVDAAQRGLRVALVDAADLGGGSTAAGAPSVSPGALPYVQRAIRQRSVEWLRVAATVLVEETTWCNVAPDCVVAPDTIQRRWQDWRRRRSRAATAAAETGDGDTEPATRTLLPALHATEMAEYVCAAMAATGMSVFCGPLRPHAVLPRSAVEARLPALACDAAQSSTPSAAPLRVRGGVIANDFALRGSVAAVSLARTAEELGVVVVSYAPVRAIREVADAATPRAAPDAAAAPGARVLRVSVQDALATPTTAVAALPAEPPARWSLWRRGPATTPPASQAAHGEPEVHVHARAVVNCSGCWADSVKAMYDGNACDTVPAAFAGYQAYSYLVAPAAGVHAATVPAVPLAETTRTTALHFNSPRLSFTSAMVLPWWDQCVLLGPCISPLSSVPEPPARTAGAVLHSPDGYAAQRRRTVMMLGSLGVAVDATRLLSCVSQIVPHVKGPREVPWSAELLSRGYALHFSSLPLQARVDTTTTTAAAAAPSSLAADAARRDVPLLHVYGGAPVLARRLAEDAVNALVHHEPPFFSPETLRQLRDCRTRHLQLAAPPPALCGGPAASAAMDAAARVEALVTSTYAERLVDVVARRTHIAYTSPVEALHALPMLASIMGGLLGWSEVRRTAEIAAARQLVRSAAVTAVA
ncbi:glycerol-3-phosphate dehydrogenase-like protein [Novymonas esmeraldas]|uniref:Glycerol-3-phosphate dehydrogenase-like protein n=1 Tax=Novymonas esmeraldas TaxID=1808958 RepID=A0AAW0F6E5_9TRYP